MFLHKGFAVTNIFSLTIGITCAMLILLWVQNELSYDKFHKNYDNVYQVIANRNFNNQVFTDRSMVLPLANELANSSPQIKNAVVTTYQRDIVLAQEEKKLKQKGYTVGDQFFDVFTWDFTKGNASTAFTAPNSIVLTESAAKTFFGDEDPINKVLKMDNRTDMKVTAIVKDPPRNSTFEFDWLTSFQYK